MSRFKIRNLSEDLSKYTGKGVKIGVIDTWLSPIVRAKYKINYKDFIGCRTDHPHGTYIVNIIFKNAPNVEMYYCRVFNYDKARIERINSALKYLLIKDLDILNCSFGTKLYNYEFEKLLRLHVNNNTLVFAPMCGHEYLWPHSIRGIISVGALYRDNNADLYCNDVFRVYEYVNKDFLLSGRSMACAYAASIGCLMREKYLGISRKGFLDKIS